MSKHKPEPPAIDGSGMRVAIVAARYNFALVNALLESVLANLDAAGVKQHNIESFRVPGSNEVPYVVGLCAETGQFDVVIALGVIIRGETDHHAIIGHCTASALQSIAIQTRVPVINGIVSAEDLKQAQARCSGELDRGTEFAHAALEMALLSAQLLARIQQVDEEFGLDGLDDMDWEEDLDDNEPDPFR